MADKQEILNTIVEILKRYSNHEDFDSALKPEAELVTDLQVNSARIVDVVLDIEEEFDIEVDDDSIESVRTFADITRIAEEKIREKEA